MPPPGPSRFFFLSRASCRVSWLLAALLHRTHIAPTPSPPNPLAVINPSHQAVELRACLSSCLKGTASLVLFFLLILVHHIHISAAKMADSSGKCEFFTTSRQPVLLYPPSTDLFSSCCLAAQASAKLNFTPDERALFGRLFRECDPEGSTVVTGEAAVRMFQRSRLSEQVLSEVRPRASHLSSHRAQGS